MKKIIFIFVLLGLWHNCYSGNKLGDYSISPRVSYPYILNANFTTILIPGKKTSILCRSSMGINAYRVGVGFGEFGSKGLMGESMTINYLMIYNDMWINKGLNDRSFIGIEIDISAYIFGAFDIGTYYSIDKDEKGEFLFVWGVGVFF